MEPLFCVSARTFIRVELPDAHVPISMMDRSELRKGEIVEKQFFKIMLMMIMCW